MYFWLVYFVWMVNFYINGMFLTCCLTCRFKRIPKLLQPMLLMATCMVTIYFKGKFTYDLNSTKYLVINIIQTALIIAYVLICFSDQWWKKILLLVSTNVAATIAEIGVRILATILNREIDLYFNDFLTVIYFAFSIFESAVCLLGIAMLWKRILGKNMVVHQGGVIVLFPISQVMVFTYCIQAIYADNISGNIPAIVALIISVAADIMVFYILMNQSEKEQLEGQLREREQLRALEAVRYEELEAKREELAKFRHDYNNWLTTALLLEEQGNTKMAKEMIGRLNEQVKV